MIEQQELVKCKGCHGEFNKNDVCDDGYCMACQYQAAANQDELTGGDHE